MPRLHLFEWEDLPWFPAVVRNAGTDFLRFIQNLGDNYAPIVPLLSDAIRSSGTTRIVDLCAGGGGPWPRLVPALEATGVTGDVLLTDRYPNTEAIAGMPGRVAYHPKSVSALAVPSHLTGFRTLFSSFHHFAPADATALLNDAVRNRVPIGVFESTKRNAACIAFMFLTPLFVLFATPFLRPFRWSRLLFTYLIPLVPVMILWDGIVSCLRTYTATELRTLIAAVPGADGYLWQTGEAKGKGPIPVTYLIGRPNEGAK